MGLENTSSKYKLIGSDGKVYLSDVKGSLGGHSKGKIYGRLDCSSALSVIQKGGYIEHRVFFANESDAIAAGYRPCGNCMKREYAEWKRKHTAPSIDEYIAAQSSEVQPILQAIRETIRANAPEAIEKISYQIPTFWQRENLIHFAAQKKHIGIYPGGEAVSVFADRLTDYKTSKGAIQFPLNKPIDHQLIEDIARWRIEGL
jgi:uncharacterized protein YdhG (YjbR/CyaY superfamily)